MAIPIKIECGCGQRYAFETEPVNGQMASAIACPSCGIDGTDAANSMISQAMPAPVMAPKPTLGLRIATPLPPNEAESSMEGISPRASGLVQPNTERAESEARSKIYWGDAPEDVVKFLMSQGFSHPDATATVKVLSQHRTVALRKIGTWKIIYGIPLMFVPVVTFIIMMSQKLLIPRLLVVAIGVGFWGLWMLIKGLIMVFVPRLETGDIADQ